LLKFYYFYNMQLKLFKILPCFILAYVGFFSHTNAYSHDNSNFYVKKFSFQNESIHNNPLSPFNFELILNNAAPKILNTPQHRTVQFSQWVNNRPTAYTISVKFLNYICGRGNSRLSHFRRLILFPFHDFW